MTSNQTRRKIRLKRFYWQGTSRSGKSVRGQQLARSEREVREQLTKQHIQVKKLKPKAVSIFSRLLHSISAKDITQFTRQLATLLGSGVALLPAIKLLRSNQAKAEMHSLLYEVGRTLEAGVPIADSFRPHQNWFDSLYCDLLSAGEQAGNLAETLQQLAHYREKSAAIKAKVVKALIYPSSVILVAVTVSYILLTWVIPEFESMFRGFGADLPWFTRQVINLSHWLQDWSLTLLGTSVFSALLLRWLWGHSPRMQLAVSRMSLKIPVFGQIQTKAALARYSRCLATSCKAGIPILNSLRNTTSAVGNLYFQRALEAAYQDISAGMPLSLSLKQTDAFPDMLTQMMMIGEESGKLDDMLDKIANVYEAEVDRTVEQLGQMIEPIIIVLLGGMVGGLVVAMYLPIFNLMSVLG
ncbi:type II secretion system F family protein [Vibrio sp.]|uniref:type II secretion system F family protein n=1 Tax=Vibrio sp. TaxID=678 RepID=UPI003D13043F